MCEKPRHFHESHKNLDFEPDHIIYLEFNEKAVCKKQEFNCHKEKSKYACLNNSHSAKYGSININANNSNKKNLTKIDNDTINLSIKNEIPLDVDLSEVSIKELFSRGEVLKTKNVENEEDCCSNWSRNTSSFNSNSNSNANYDYDLFLDKKGRKSRSSSVPSVKKSKTKIANPREIELFNPNYNFNKNPGKMSLIESIRHKVFNIQPNQQKRGSLHSCEYEIDDVKVKFPKETKNAVRMQLANEDLPMCKFCLEKEKNNRSCNKIVNDNQTQTSPRKTETPIAHEDNYIENNALIQMQIQQEVKLNKNVCLKNLLCTEGVHRGKCQIKENGSKMFFRSVYLDVENCKRCPCHKGFSKEDAEDSSSYCPTWPSECSVLEPKIVVDKKRTNFSLPIPSSKMDFNTTAKMNGLNGHSNGDSNGCGDIITQNQQKGCWTIGLINSKFRYLTAETFGFKINANGASLKKKQVWTLEPDNGGESLIYLKSHLDKYLAVDSFGNVTCESEEKEAGCKFQISVAEDNSGRWALRNVVRGYFLGSSSDKLTCTAKVPGDAEFWHVHLAARPQVNLRSIGRKRFAHLSENLDEIHVDANIPWGEDTLFTLEFRQDESGKYALHTCNNKYLSFGGKLVDTCTKDCLFSAEYHSGQLALRDRNGAYLSPIGSKAVLKTRSTTVTKDELFSLEDSLPQASFVAALNSRYVSVKQGVDVTANQDEISDHETFQLEFDWSTKRWYIRTMQDRYWTLETGGGIQAAGDKRSSNALFDLVWQGDGSVAFRANNGRYVITKRSGHLYATSDNVDDTCKYYFYLINRPILVLKSEQGFVGYKSAGNPKLECNKATYETIQVERAEKGVVHFKGLAGKYWHVDSEGVTCDSDNPEGFYLELREPTRLCIKTTSGSYLVASKNGSFHVGDSNVDNATKWEY